MTDTGESNDTEAPSDPPTKQHRHEWRLAVVAAVASLVGGLISGALSFAAVSHQGHAQDISAQRSNRRDLYTTFFQLADKYYDDVTSCSEEAPTQQQPQLPACLDTLRSENYEILHQSDDLLLLGSTDVGGQAVRLTSRAIALQDLIAHYFTEAAKSSPGPSVSLQSYNKLSQGESVYQTQKFKFLTTARKEIDIN